MANWLRARGYDVRVVTTPPYYPAWRVHTGYRAWWYGREILEGVEVWRAPLWVPKRAGMVRRLLHLTSFAVSSLPLVLWLGLRWRPDVVWTVEPTVAGTPGALLTAWLARGRSWLHVQDIEFAAAARLGLIRSPRLAGASRGFYRWLLRRFDRVSTISRTMAAELAELGAPAATLFPNWVDVDSIHPAPTDSALKTELGVPPRALVALYSGNIGTKQGVETLIDAARRLAHRHDIHFLICGEGTARAEVGARAAGLANVTFGPLQPSARLNALLNLADVQLLPQRRGNTVFAMPSKLGGMLASGRAVVAQADLDSEFAALLAGNAELVPAEDAAATAAAIERLADDPARRRAVGARGRALAVERLSHQAILASFAAQLEAAVGPMAVSGTDKPLVTHRS